MELMQQGQESPGMFFKQAEFVLKSNGIDVAKLMAMVTVPGEEVDITVIVPQQFQRMRYGTLGVRMLMDELILRGFTRVRITNMFGSTAVNRIAKRLGFKKSETEERVWTRELLGSA